MAWWPFGRNRREPAALPFPATQPVIRSAERDGAWQDLPALQRTLADPIRPVAITDDFRNSLAAYADPSLVAPLAHQVDPEAGGLVEGLVSPGLPYAHPSGPELSVPPRPNPPMKSRVPAGSAQIQTLSLQRNVISSGSTDLSTVALELPETGWSAHESQPQGEPEILAPAESQPPGGPEILAPAESQPPGGPEILAPAQSSPPVDAAIPAGTPAPSEGAVPPETPRAVEIPSVQRRTGDEHGSNVIAPVISTRALPVVARSVDPSRGAELPQQPRSGGESVASPAHAAPRETTNTDLPVVSRLAKPTAESLSGFAAAITNLTAPGDVSAEPATPATNDHDAPIREDQAGSNDDDHPVADDHPAQADLSAPDVPIQRLASQERSASVGESEAKPAADAKSEANPAAEVEEANPATEAESEANPAAQEELPVVVPSPPSVSDIALPVVSRRSETPTLGIRLAQSPLSLQRAPLTERVSPPTKPAIQRVEFVTPQVASARRAPAARGSFQASSPVSTPETSTRPTPAPVAPPTAQRLTSQDGKPGSNPPARHSPAVSRRETQVREAAGELPMQQLGSFEPVVAQRVTSSELSVRRELAAPEVNVSTVEVPVRPAAGVSPERSAAEAPPGPAEVPVGPAIIPEPWTTVSHTIEPGPAQPASQPALPTVSRLATGAPVHRSPRAAGSSPTLAVGPSISHATAERISAESPPNGTMSFASMFSAPASSEAGSPVEDGFTSVQLQAPSESTPSASEPAADTSPSSAPPVSTSLPPAASDTKPADLDELARRLYEPLTARLRAELWLDRERAGVTTDV